MVVLNRVVEESTSSNRIEGPPSCIFSIIMLRVVDTRLSRLILSLADTPVVMRSMSIVPFGGKESKSEQRINTSNISNSIPL